MIEFYCHCFSIEVLIFQQPQQQEDMQKYLERREEHLQQHQHPDKSQNPTVGAKIKLCFWKFLTKRSLKGKQTKPKNSQATKT